MNITKIIFLLLCSIVLIACESQADDEDEVSFTIPYLTECNATIYKAARHFEHRSNSKPGKGRVEIVIEKFDNKYMSDLVVDGVVRVTASGDLKLLDGVSSLRYITGIAGSIVAECMPDTYVSLELPVINSLYNRLKKETGFPVIPVIKGNKIFLYKNSLSYKADHWD